MILAKLPGRIALLLEQVGNGWCPVRNPMRRSRHADGQQARTKWILPQDERRAASGAALLGIGISEKRTFLGDAIDVGCFVAHHAVIVGTDVAPADVIPPND